MNSRFSKISNADGKPYISVIVPVYNVQEYLDECVSDIVAQTFYDIEVLLIDDGSSDGSGLKCEEWQRRDPRVKTTHKTNGGVCETRNLGLENAGGKWIIFIDADDRIDKELLSNLIKAQIEKQADIVGTSYRLFLDEIGENDSADFHVRETNKRQYLKQRGGEYICGALYKKDIIDQAGLWFDTSLVRHEEVFWNSIYDMYCKKYAFISPPQYYYRKNPHSLMHTRNTNITSVREWLLARQSLDNWRKAHKKSLKKASCIQAGILHCEKNCFAECLNAGLQYDDFKKICADCDIPNALWNSAIYYQGFKTMLQLRKIIFG